MKNEKMILAMVLTASFGMAFGETLQEQIDAAADGATIEWSGKTGPIEVRGKSLTIVGGKGAVIDGGGTSRCAYLGAAGTTGVTLRNFTLQNGQADWGAGAYGGKLVGCTVKGCAAALAGGAYGSTLENCTVTGCSAVESGAALGGCAATGCTISGNRRTASDSDVAVHGGLLFDTKLEWCTVRGNELMFGAKAPVKGAVGYRVAMTGGTNGANVVSVDRQLVYGELEKGDFYDSSLTGVVSGGDDPGPAPEPEPEPPEPPVLPDWRADTAYVNIYHKADLAEICQGVPTDHKVTVKAEGFPKGMKLVTTALRDERNKATGHYAYAIEGVPTETLDGSTRIAYVRVTETDKSQTLVKLNFRVLPASEYEQIAFPDATVGVGYAKVKVTWYWPAITNASAKWSFSGWPSGLKLATKPVTATVKSGDRKITVTNAVAWQVYGTPKKAGVFTVKATEKIAGTSYRSTHVAKLTVRPAKLTLETQVDPANVGLYRPGLLAGVKSASGLPTGLKFTRKATSSYEAYSVYGTPTKAGSFTVSCTQEDGQKSQFFWTVTPFEASACGLLLGAEAADPQTAKSTVRQGVAYSWSVTNALGAKVSASGLPTGLKLKSTAVKSGTKTVGYAYAVKGVPTKAGEYLATFKTTQNKVTRVSTAAFTVKSLPSWAQGTFDGGADATFPAGGKATFTVSKVGKLSGKWMSEGTNWVMSAGSYARYDEATGAYVADVVRKAGSGRKAVAVTNALTVVADAALVSIATNDLFVAYRNNWKDNPWKAVAKGFARGGTVTWRPHADSGEISTNDVITLKFATSGKVTVKGKFAKSISQKGKVSWHEASGSAVLCPQEPVASGAPFAGVVFVYFPPKAKTPLTTALAACLEVQWTGGAFGPEARLVLPDVD